MTITVVVRRISYARTSVSCRHSGARLQSPFLISTYARMQQQLLLLRYVTDLTGCDDVILLMLILMLILIPVVTKGLPYHGEFNSPTLSSTNGIFSLTKALSCFLLRKKLE